MNNNMRVKERMRLAKAAGHNLMLDRTSQNPGYQFFTLYTPHQPLSEKMTAAEAVKWLDGYATGKEQR